MPADSIAGPIFHIWQFTFSGNTAVDLVRPSVDSLRLHVWLSDCQLLQYRPAAHLLPQHSQQPSIGRIERSGLRSNFALDDVNQYNT